MISKNRFKNMMKTKAGQITVFVILGIVLIFSSILIYVIKSQISENTLSGDQDDSVTVPITMQPVTNFVQECIEINAISGLKTLGQHGGYIDMNEFEINSTSYFKDSVSSNALNMFPNWDVPYYYYRESQNLDRQNKCASEMPPLESSDPRSVKSQLENYMNKKISECVDLDKLEAALGNNIEISGSPKTKVTFTDGDVIFDVNYPLSIVEGGERIEYSQYYATIPVKFKQMYTLAKDITAYEQKNNFLEKQTLNMISIYSFDDNLLPPIADADFTLKNIKMWNKRESKTRVTEILQNQISLYQVLGTNNFYMVSTDDNYERGIYSAYNLFLNTSNLTRYDFDADFMYQDTWQIYFDIKGKGVRGDMILPEFMSLPVLPMSIKRYRFYYQVSFPVVVTLTDDSPEMRSIFGLDGSDSGYEYYFALEGNIRNNEPANCSYEAPIEETKVFDTSCELYNYMNCSHHTVSVVDYLTREPVPETQINMNFGQVECYGGVTVNETMNMTLPTGAGVLEVNNFNYLEQTRPVIISCNKSKNITFELMPFKYINFTVEKYPTAKVDYGTNKWDFVSNTSTEFSNNEVAIVMLTRVKENPADPEYQTVGYFDLEAPLSGINVLKLVPGKYEVEIYTFQNMPYRGENRIVIPKETKTYPTGLFGSEDIEFPEISFNDSFYEGSTEFNADTAYFEISPDELYISSNITFYAITSPGMGLGSLTQDDLQEMGNTLEHIEDKGINFFKPKFG